MDKIRDEKIPEYLKTLEKEKVLFPKVTLDRYGDNNLAIRAKTPIQDGDIVLSVPLDLLLNNVTLRSRIWPDLQTFDPRAYGCDKWSLTYLFIATEYAKGESSPYWTYLSMIPRNIDTPISYSPEVLEMIANTNLHEAVTEIREKLHGIQKMYRQVLCPRYPQLFPPSKLTEEEEYTELVWAYEAFWSRAFAVMIKDPYDPDWDENTAVASLVPLCGMLNHSPDAHVTYITDVKNGVFCIQSNMPVEAGAQFYNNYRNRSNEKMLLNYGFFIPENPLDTFTIKVNVHPGMDPLYPRKRALLQASGIAWEHYLSKDPEAPIPSSLLDCLRILSMSESELYFRGGAKYNNSDDNDNGCCCCETIVSERNEAEALRTLSILLDKHLAKLKYPDYNADFDRIHTLDTTKYENYSTYAALYYRAWQAKILTQSAAYARKRYAEKMKSLVWNPKFVASPRCTDPEALDAFNTYAESANIFRGVRYVRVDDGVRLVATRRLTRGEPIIAIPAADLLGNDAAALRESFGDDVRSIASRVDSDSDPNSFEILTSLFLIASLTGKLVDSKVRPLVSHFLCCLPRAVVSPVFLSTDTIENSFGELPLVDDALGFREQIMAEHQTVAANKKVKRSGVATKDYIWARVTLEPRIVDIPAASAPNQALSGSRCMAMLPLPFLPRYSPYHKLERRFDASEGVYLICAGYDVDVDEEVFSNDGYDQPSDHLLRFGSLLASNPLAIHQVSFEWDDGDEDMVKLDLLKRLGLSVENNLLSKGQFPYPLLHTFEVLNMTDEEICKLTSQLDDIDQKKSGLSYADVVAQDVSDETEGAAFAMLKNSLLGTLDTLPQVNELDASSQKGDLTDALASYIAQQRSIVTYTLERLQEIAGDKLKDDDDGDSDDAQIKDSIMSEND